MKLILLALLVVGMIAALVVFTFDVPLPFTETSQEEKHEDALRSSSEETWGTEEELRAFIEDAERRIDARDSKISAEYYEAVRQVEHSYRLRYIEPRMKKATLDQYMQWLCGFTAEGNTPSHVYDYPMGSTSGEVVIERSVPRYGSALDSFFVAKENFRIVPLYGADTMRIIIPEGVEFLGGDLGHTHLYFMDGYVVRSNIKWVPTYTDTQNC